jgi:phosphatidylinositol alpha-1,6-mannosyltransferase
VRILHITPYYWPSVAGLPRHVQALSEGLAARDHEVTVFTSDLSGSAGLAVDAALPPREAINGVEVRRFRSIDARVASLLNLPGATRVARALLGAERARALADGPWLPGLAPAFRALRPDVALVGSAEHEALLVQALRARGRSPTRLFCLPLLHLEHAWSRSRIVARALSRMDGVFANTEHERAFIAANVRPVPRCHVAGVGVDPAPFKAADGARVRRELGLGDDPVVAYVARFEAEKGVVAVLGAMRSVWSAVPSARLLLAGHRFPRESPADRAFAAALSALSDGQRARVTVVEGFAEGDKASLFDACDVFALPSIAESFGIVYLEAWLCGKPVIGARIGAVQCVIDDGHDGLLVDPANEAELATAILALLADPARRRAMGEAGRAKTLARYTWASICDIVERAYADRGAPALAGRQVA